MNRKRIFFVIAFLILVIIVLTIVLLVKETPISSYSNDYNEFIEQELEESRAFIRDIHNLIESADTISNRESLSDFYNENLQIMSMMQDLRNVISSGENVNVAPLNSYIDSSYYKDKASIQTFIHALRQSKVTLHEKLYIVSLLENHLLENNIRSFYAFYSLPFTSAIAINCAKKDTVSLGDTYRSRILFNVRDLPGNIIVMENGDTLKSGYFERKASKKGEHKEKGYLQISNGFNTKFYKVEIDYYVK